MTHEEKDNYLEYEMHRLSFFKHKGVLLKTKAATGTYKSETDAEKHRRENCEQNLR